MNWEGVGKASVRCRAKFNPAPTLLARYTLSVVGSDVKASNLTERELGNTLVPALDDLAYTDGAGEGLAAVARRVELLAVLEGSDVLIRRYKVVY